MGDNVGRTGEASVPTPRTAGGAGGPSPVWSRVLVAVAAFAVAAASAVSLARFQGGIVRIHIVPGMAPQADEFALVVLGLGVAVGALVGRVGGWVVALTGLLLAAAAEPVALTLLSAPVDVSLLRSASLVGAAGVGLALGGVLRAAAGASRSARLPMAVGLAAGLVLREVYAASVRAGLPKPDWSTPDQMQFWPAIVLVVVALLTSRRSGGPASVTGRRNRVSVMVVAVAGLLVSAGFVTRWLPWAGSDLSDMRLGAPFVLLVSVLMAAVAGLLLLGHAFHATGVVGTRWVVLAIAVGLVGLFSWGLNPLTAPGLMVLVGVIGLAAVWAGAALARHAAWILPWDALGIIVAGVALPLSSPTVRIEMPSAPTVGAVLTAFGLGLAVGSGLTLVLTHRPGAPVLPPAPHRTIPTPPAPRPAVPHPVGPRPAVPHPVGPPPASPDPVGPPPVAGDSGSSPHPVAGRGGDGGQPGIDRGWRATVLALGFAGWVLAAYAAVPIWVTSLGSPPGTLSSLTLPLLACGAGVLLVLLFGFGLLVEHLHRDPADAPPPAGRPRP